MKTSRLKFTVNGQDRSLDVADGLMLIDVLHEQLNLTGTRFGCGLGICHACVVIVDGKNGAEELRSCITPATACAGMTIRTIESHAQRNGEGSVVQLSPVQQAFVEHYSFQCGYCTPGFVNAATVLIERLKREPIEKTNVESTVIAALDSHLCRCTGYVRYHEAVRDLVLNTPGLTR